MLNFDLQTFPASIASQFSSSVLAAHGATLAQQTTVSSALQLQIPSVSGPQYLITLCLFVEPLPYTNNNNILFILNLLQSQSHIQQHTQQSQAQVFEESFMSQMLIECLLCVYYVISS